MLQNNICSSGRALPLTAQAQQRNLFFNSAMYTFLLMFCLFTLPSKAQFLPASSPEVQYPDVSMSPPSLNLDPRFTKYLSNFAFPGSGVLSGSTIELTGWSTDNDGGFSYGTSLPGIGYTGIGALTIPNARDVQVGYLEHSPIENYIIASYYDVSKSLYAYDLYRWDFFTGTVTKLYDYVFQDPNFVMPSYTPSTGFIPSGPTPPVMSSTMGYNRISMDIDQHASRVVIALTDNVSGDMYTTVGQVAVDTVIFSPNLPGMPLHPSVSYTGSGIIGYASLTYAPITPPGPITTAAPTPDLDYATYSGSYVLHSSGLYYDLFDAATGFYVRYWPGTSPEKYHYSYYPIDLGIYVTEYLRTGPSTGSVEGLLSPAKQPYSPLIRVKAVSTVTTPCVNPYYKQYWPDVAFSGNDHIGFVFYAYDLNDLYVIEPSTTANRFSDLFSFTGGSIAAPRLPGSPCANAGITDMQAVARNTADGRYLSSDYITGLGHLTGLESECKSLPRNVEFPEIRAKIDAPDLPSTSWAIALAYRPASFMFTSTPLAPYLAYTPGGPIIHAVSDYNKYNVYVRSNFLQSIVNNGSLGNLANNIDPNIEATIAYGNMLSPNNVTVAWASERAGAIHGTAWGYIAVELQRTSPFSPFTRKSLMSYLLLANDPTLNCGDNPLVALSKHNDGLQELYSNFTQEDATGLYSVQHKDHHWVSGSGAWKQTDNDVLTGASANEKLSVAPNPFTNSLHISAVEDVAVQLSDILGRNIGNYTGNATDVNKQLDAQATQLSAGTYLLKINTASGKSEVFKLTKQ